MERYILVFDEEMLKRVELFVLYISQKLSIFRLS